VTIFQRRDGRWVARVQRAGRRKDLYARSEAEARRKAEAYLAALGQRPLPQPGRRTVQDLLQAFLASTGLRPKTAAWYADLARRHLGPVLRRRLADLEPLDVLAVLQPLRDRPRTAQAVYRLLHRVLAFAVRCGYLSSNPAASIEPPRYRPARRAVWTQEQLAAFLRAAEGYRLRPLFLLLATTGLRLSEALALTWAQVDLKTGTVRVERGVHRVRGAWVFTEPKTRAGSRIVSLPPSVLEVLKRARRQAMEEGLRSGRGFSEDQLIFTGRSGQPLHQRQVLEALRKLAARAGLPYPGGLHALRHLHASLLLAGGAPLPEVARRLGHSTPAVTASVYSHALREDRHLAEAVERTLQEVRP
jgi:integrase